MPKQPLVRANQFSVRLNPVNAMESLKTQTRPLTRPLLTRSHPRGQRAAFENLESRQMMSVTTDSNGFTVVTPPAGAKVVYVSTQGSNSNDGLTPTTPVKTLAYGAGLISDGTGDQLLLKRGDTWHESFGYWYKGGASADAPLVIGAYGTGVRPTVATGVNMAISFGTASHTVVNHVVLSGIRFYADTRDPNSPTFSGAAGTEGIRVTTTADDILIEDCASQFYTAGINLYDTVAPMTNIRVRRCVVTDAYSTTFHAQGLFAYGINGLTLDGNVFDHNGWNSQVAGAQATIYNHDVYITNTVSNFVAKNNLFANASNFGLQARSGGVVENNVFLNDPVGLSFGLVNGSTSVAGGVTGDVKNNVFTSTNIQTANPPGWGITIGNTKPGGGTVVRGNVFKGNPANGGNAIMLQYGTGNTNPETEVGINDLTIENNVVYGWARGLSMMSGFVPGGTGATAINGLVVRNNGFQNLATRYALMVTFDSRYESFSNNTYDSAAGVPLIETATGTVIPWSTWSATDVGSTLSKATYPNVSVTAATYAGTIGLAATEAAYIAAARGQGSDNWQRALVPTALGDFIMNGFGVADEAGTSHSTVGTRTSVVPPGRGAGH